MKRSALPVLSILFLLLCALIVSLNAWAVFAGEESTSGSEVWAESIVTFKAGAGNIGSNFSDPESALGPVDSGIVSIGNAQIPSAPPADPTSCEAVLIVGFGRHAILDGPGDDLTIYELAVGSLLEPTWVYIGGAGADWRYVGESQGSRNSLDISHVADASDSFSRVAICDIPDGDTTTGATPGPDIDAIAAHNTILMEMVAQAQGPGWSIDLDPALDTKAADVFVPMPELQDIGIQAPTVFRYECPKGDDLNQCSSFLIIKSRCGRGLSLTPPGWFIYPFLFPTLSDHPTLRDMQGTYQEEDLEELYAFCFEQRGRSAVVNPQPVTVFSLEEGGARFDIVEKTWRYELKTTTTSVYSEGANQFAAVHYPASEETVLRAFRGNVMVDPTASGKAPFSLSAGQQVVISKDGPGPVIDLDHIYLPAALR